MKTIDLSHVITSEMPVYPGTEKPLIQQANTHAAEGFAEKKLTFYSHIGTHIDAPAHILAGEATLDELGVDQFIGNGICISVKQSLISASSLEKQLTNQKNIDFVLFSTGWSKYWGSNEYFSGYPVLTDEAARMLCSLGLKGIGFDTISADSEGSADFPIHKILLKKMIVIENLTNLEPLINQVFVFCCLPLKIKDGDGSPVRAVGMVNAKSIIKYLSKRK